MRKVLAVVLAAAMMLTMGVTAFAETNTIDVDCADLIGVTGDTTTPNTTVYYVIDENDEKDYTNDDKWKVKIDKGDNAKIISSISIVEKELDAKNGQAVDAGREIAIKIKFNNYTTDTEYKLNPTVTFKPTGDNTVTDNQAFAFKFFVNNTIKNGDYDWENGQGGYVAKPTKNDDNEVTWENENDTVAMLEFIASSSVNSYYPKLSTSWNNQVYADNFKDQDAFLFDFVTNPTISSTSRAKLTIYNPYVNEDDELTVEDVIIYQWIDEALVDVTDDFTIGEDDNGDYVLTTKLRTLGTYIVCEAEAATVTDTVADEAPVTKDGKDVPNTGR